MGSDRLLGGVCRRFSLCPRAGYVVSLSLASARCKTCNFLSSPGPQARFFRSLTQEVWSAKLLAHGVCEGMMVVLSGSRGERNSHQSMAPLPIMVRLGSVVF